MKCGFFIMIVLGASLAQTMPSGIQSAPAMPGGDLYKEHSLNQVQILALLAGDVTSERVAMLVTRRGIEFSPTEEYLELLQKAGAKQGLVEAVRTATASQPFEAGRAGEVNQEKVQQHLLIGMEYKRNKQYLEAEEQYRAAQQLQPDNPALHFSLGYILAEQDSNKYSEAISELQDAVRLDSGNADAHRLLGLVFLADEAPHPALPAFREFVRLEPNDSEAHYYLADTLLMTRELDSAIAEYRGALRLKPDYFEAHVGLGAALLGKKDPQGAIAELGAALRARPNDAETHFNLAAVLEDDGDERAALEHYRVAQELEPSNSLYRFRYERLSRKLGVLTSKEKP